MDKYYTVLSIAGSDSSGGAGIQADIKSISACGGYAGAIITATTAQNTQGVRDIHAIPIPHLISQIEAVLDDIAFDAIKIGMLHSFETIEAVAKTVQKYNIKNIILDPVMVSTSGHTLMDNNAIEALKDFLPFITLVTPNIPEAEILLDKKITNTNVKKASKELGEKYKVSVLLKGGHLAFTNKMTDTLYHYKSKEILSIENKAIESKNTHGTGCSLSSAIATFLAKGEDLENAVIKGSSYLNKAIEDGKDKIIGKGHGAVNHFSL